MIIANGVFQMTSPPEPSSTFELLNDIHQHCPALCVTVWAGVEKYGCYAEPSLGVGVSYTQ